MTTPEELASALAGNAQARERFESLPSNHQVQYIEWITEARKPETRARRAAKAVEMLLADRKTT